MDDLNSKPGKSAGDLAAWVAVLESTAKNIAHLRHRKETGSFMSAKEAFVVAIGSAKEKLGEAMTELQGVVSQFEETQATVSAVMGDVDPNFAAAQSTIEAAGQALIGVSDELDTAITYVNAAGQS